MTYQIHISNYCAFYLKYQRHPNKNSLDDSERKIGQWRFNIVETTSRLSASDINETIVALNEAEKARVLKVDPTFFVEDTNRFEKLISDYCDFYEMHQRQPGILGEERRLGYWRLNIGWYRHVAAERKRYPYPNDKQLARILAVDPNFFIVC